LNTQIRREISLPLLAQFVICALAVVSLLYFPVPILSLLANKYHVTTAQAANSLSAFGFAYAIGFLIFGALSDRLGRKRVMLYGLVTLTVVTVCLAFVTKWQFFIALRVLQGLAAATFPPVALAYLSENGTPPQKMQAIAWMSTAFLAAGILGQVYAMQIAIALGLGWALSGLAIVYFVTALRLAFVRDRKPAAVAKGWGETYKPIFFLFNNRVLCRVYLSAVLLLLCFVAFYLALDAYLGEIMLKQGISKLQMRMVALPAFALTLFAPKLIMRLKGPHKVVTLGLTISTIGLLSSAIFAGMDWHPAWILASSVVFVAGIALSVPSLIARTTTATELEIRGIAVSFYTFVLFAGASFAPFLVRGLAQYSLETVLFFLSFLLVCAALYNISFKEERRHG